MKILLAACNAKYIHSNLAVFNLKACAKEYDSNVVLREYTINQQKDDILKDIYRCHPDVICISCYIWNITFVRELMQDLRKILPDVPFWAGGPEVSYDAEEFLKKNPAFDGIMVGEGEETFLELVKHYVNGSPSLEETTGLVYCKPDGTIQNNGWRQIMDLSRVPFAYENLKDFENRIIYYESSRGCPFSCSYCLSSVDKKLRFRDLELVKKELQFFLDHKVPQVKFVDRTFNCRHEHAMGIWNYIKEHDNGITNFHFEISADLLREDELELISDMRPGLIQLEIGVQSTNGATIREIHRTMRLEDVYRAVNRVKAGKNIHQHLDLIAGLPYEDYDRFRQSFNDVYQMEPEQLQLGFLKVLKGSRMYDMAEIYGIVYRKKAPYEVLKTDWMSYDDILKLKGVEEMVEIYYNSHQFEQSVTYLMHFYKAPFDFFEDLAAFYEQCGFGKVQHGRMQRYDILLQFAEKRHLGKVVNDMAAADKKKDIQEVHGDAIEILKATMLYDLYARENLKSRPEWAHEILYRPLCEDFYRNREMTERYLPSYEGCTARQMKRMTHMEGFAMDIRATAASGQWTGKPEVLLFDYKERNPLTYAAKMTAISVSECNAEMEETANG